MSLYIGVEKAGMVIQLQSWFGDLGIPILAALGRYSSQTYVDDVTTHAEDQERPAVLLYAGDFDPSGEDIDRDFEERTACWDQVIRVALSARQVRDYGLPPNPGKATDSRAGAFVPPAMASWSRSQLDALDPDNLRTLFTEAVGRFWDTSAYESVLAQERAEQARADCGRPRVGRDVNGDKWLSRPAVLWAVPRCAGRSGTAGVDPALPWRCTQGEDGRGAYPSGRDRRDPHSQDRAGPAKKGSRRAASGSAFCCRGDQRHRERHPRRPAAVGLRPAGHGAHLSGPRRIVRGARPITERGAYGDRTGAVQMRPKRSLTDSLEKGRRTR